MFTVLSTTLLHMYRIFILANTNIQNPLKIILFNFHFFAFTNSRDTFPLIVHVPHVWLKNCCPSPFFAFTRVCDPLSHVFTVCVVPICS